jgi:hypothetical protein
MSFNVIEATSLSCEQGYAGALHLQAELLQIIQNISGIGQ